jgi:hypothetical protein
MHQEKIMISRRAVSFGIFTALALASGLAAEPAFAFTRDVQSVPFDGKTSGPAYHQHGSGISCFVVGASCNKGPMPPSMSNGGRWERGYPSYPSYPSHDGRQPMSGGSPTRHNTGLGGPY